MTWIRYTLATIAGVVIALVLISAFEAAGHALFAGPADTDMSTPAAVAAYMQKVPVGALVIVLAGWIVGTFAGVIAACMVARVHPIRFAAVVGGLVFAATVANLMMTPHPLWMTIAAVIGIPLATSLAARVMSARAQRPPVDASSASGPENP